MFKKSDSTFRVWIRATWNRFKSSLVNIIYTILLSALIPLSAQDSTKYDRSIERDIYIQKRIMEAKSIKQQVRKWVMVGTVAVADAVAVIVAAAVPNCNSS